MIKLACVSVLVVGAVVTCGCGGDVTDEDASSGAAAGATGAGGGGASSGSSASSSSSGEGGAVATAASTSGAGGVGDDCANVPQYIDNLLAAAAACNGADPSLHCQDIVDGFCCPVVVESISSPETQAYLDFLALTQRQCPEMWRTCEVVDCAFPEPGNCVEDASGQGHCEPFAR